RQVRDPVLHVVARADLIRATVPASVVGDDTESALQEERHLDVPVVGRQRPAVTKHDRLTRAPVFVEDFDTVRSSEGGHGIRSFPFLRVNTCGWSPCARARI